MTRNSLILAAIFTASLASSGCTLMRPHGQPGNVAIVSSSDSYLAGLASREVYRYIYQRTGHLAQIERSIPARGDAIVLTANGAQPPEAIASNGMAEAVRNLAPQQYLLKTVKRKEGKMLIIAGGDEAGVLYGAYRFAECLGVRFYLHGDTIPDERIALTLPDLDEQGKPIFNLRGIQPFHDFTEGPDWWSREDWRMVVSQVAKMRMNFIGLHNYNNEPAVWVGLPRDVGIDGSVRFSAPKSYITTQRYLEYGLTRPQKTSDYVFGGAHVFEDDVFGPDTHTAADIPYPKTPEASAALIDRVGGLYRDAFSRANRLGIKTCIGRESPLYISDELTTHLQELGLDPASPEVQQELYEGMLLRIKRAFPVDYFWLWGHEGDITQDSFIANMKQLIAARDKVDAPFGLGICGWGWIANNFLALDTALPKSVTFSCISMSVGHDPVSPNFGKVQGREKWAIPWFEDDAALITPQLWVGRMRKDALDARAYGCNGLMGLHWRTRVLAPNISALARAGWTQSGWEDLEEPADAGKPQFEVLGGKNAAYLNTPVEGTEDDIVYQTVRYDLQGYRFLAPAERYTVTLQFCEVATPAVGSRVFDVKLQGKTVLENLDIFAEAGSFKALDYVYKDVEPIDGAIRVDFTAKSGLPAVAGISIESPTLSFKVNCGGQEYGQYQADATQDKDRVQPSGDFYLDWATAEFGPQVASETARIFADLDGVYPRPSGWDRGPGVIVVNPTPWEKEEPRYRFVEQMEALRPSVDGAGNLARFDWWLSQFRYTRAMAQFGCVRAELDAVMREIETLADLDAKSKQARERALPLRLQLVAPLGEMYTCLLETLHNASELGTIANVNQQSILRKQVLSLHDEKLEALLGEPLPAQAQPWKDYRGPARLFVLTQRAEATQGESLALRIVALAGEPFQEVALYWRPMGHGDFQRIDARHGARAVYHATLPPASGEALEYYVRGIAPDGATLVWPPTAPELSQTLVVVGE